MVAFEMSQFMCYNGLYDTLPPQLLQFTNRIQGLLYYLQGDVNAECDVCTDWLYDVPEESTMLPMLAGSISNTEHMYLKGSQT